MAHAPPNNYRRAFMEARARPWSVEDPGGNIVSVVAENRLSLDMLAVRATADGNIGSRFRRDKTFRS